MPVVLDVRVLRGTGGGPEKTLFRSPKYLKQYGYDMVCIYLCSPDDKSAQKRIMEARQHDVKIVVIPDKGTCDLGVLSRAGRAIDKIGPHIYHGHDYKSNILGSLLPQCRKVFRVSTLHGWVDYDYKLKMYYLIERWCLRCYDRIYYVSPELHNQALRYRLPENHLRYLPNGIELAEYKRERNCIEARRRLGLADGIWLGSVGRLVIEKNFSSLLWVVATLWRQGYPVYCLLVGDGPMKEYLENEARNLGIASRVHFAGYQRDVRPWLECMDVYVCTSLREGMPNSILEAMAMEVPIVATKVGGVSCMIRDGEDGLLVEPGDVEKIVKVVRDILEGRINKHNLIDAARRRVEREFSFERRMQVLAEDYDRLLGRRALSH